LKMSVTNPTNTRDLRKPKPTLLGCRKPIRQREGDAHDLVEDVSDDEDTPVTETVAASELTSKAPLAVQPSAQPAAACGSNCAMTPAACEASAPDPAVAAPVAKKTVSATTNATPATPVTGASDAGNADAPAGAPEIAAPAETSKAAAGAEKCATDAVAVTDQDCIVIPPQRPTVQA
jgi:hypothetical protein